MKKSYYDFNLDKITLPPKDQFDSVETYAQTFYHEVTHWTGHVTRLDRDLGPGENYGREELVAELGAAFLCGHHGLSYTTQHASYIAGWLKLLKEDKRAIFKATSKAQRAYDFIIGYDPSEKNVDTDQNI